MVPSVPTLGPGLMALPRFAFQRICPVWGPRTTASELCVASCSASGHGAYPVGAGPDGTRPFGWAAVAVAPLP